MVPRRLFFAVASMLIGAGTVALVVGSADRRNPTLNLSVGGQTPTTDEEPPVSVVSDDTVVSSPPSTMWTIPGSPTTTSFPRTPPPTTAVAPLPPTTVTTLPPTTTTSAVRTAKITATNHYPGVVKITAGDETNNNWTLNAGESAAPWLMLTADAVHGDGASIIRVDTMCGSGDGENYFLAGHAYVLEAVPGLPDSCSPGIAAPRLLVHDLTTGTTRQI